MRRTRAVVIALAAGSALLAAPAIASAAPIVETTSVNETTLEISYTNTSSSPATCGGLLHFFGSPLSWFGLPPAVIVPPNGTATQQVPYVIGGIHTVSWWCDVPGEELHTGRVGPVAVGGLADVLVDGFNQMAGS
ncbi:hypothetical protein [Lolliginicoccus levis]|uniref:hypothetical protein n=1 Tax=Lolliginicoccus levis TaxID=2919542 RepID=UPI00241FACB5|nr:hypothetical protein [Lolliginicoccus levis]